MNARYVPCARRFHPWLYSVGASAPPSGFPSAMKTGFDELMPNHHHIVVFELGVRSVVIPLAVPAHSIKNRERGVRNTSWFARDALERWH